MVLWTLAFSIALAVAAGFGAQRISRTEKAQSCVRFTLMDGVLMSALFIPYAVFKILALQQATLDFARRMGEPLAALLEGLTLVAILMSSYFLSWSINRLR